MISIDVRLTTVLTGDCIKVTNCPVSEVHRKIPPRSVCDDALKSKINYFVTISFIFYFVIIFSLYSLFAVIVRETGLLSSKTSVVWV